MWHHVTYRVSPTQHAMGCGPNGRRLWNGVDLLQPPSVVRAASVSSSQKLQQLPVLKLTPTQTLSPVCAGVWPLAAHRRETFPLLIWFLTHYWNNRVALWKWYHDNWCIKTLLTLSVNEPGSPFFSLKEILLFFSVNWRVTAPLPESTLALCASFKKSCVDESVG